MTISPAKTALLLSYICIASVSTAIITPALPQIEQTYALTGGALEWVISIFLFGYMVGQLIYGPVANRFGRITALRSGLVLNLFGLLICIFANYIASYNLLLVGRFITALGAASGLSCTFMLMNELLPAHRAKHAMSFAPVSFTVGVGIAVTLGGIITQYWHWQDCFWVLLVHGAVMLFFTRAFPETLTKKTSLHPKNILGGYLSALKNSRLVTFALTVGLSSSFIYTYSAAAPIYAQDNLGLSPSAYGYWNLLNMAGILVSGFLSASLVKQYGAKRVLGFTICSILPCWVAFILLLSIVQPTILWFFSVSTLLFLLSGLLFPAASYFASTAIDNKANASSMMSFVNMFSATMSVIILGYLPLSPIFSFIAVISVFFVAIGSLALYQLRSVQE